jgi:membrane-bound lytic murein transglycosylase MltF
MGYPEKLEEMKLASNSKQRRSFFWLPIFCLILATDGCSPVSEGLVKRAQSDQNSKNSTSAGHYYYTQHLHASVSSADRLIIQSYAGVVKKYARQYGLDWRLVLAVMKVESRFSHEAESEMGAAGLMQIMPVTSDEVARVLDIEDMAHPMNNIHGGVYYLRKLYNLFDGAEEKDRIELTLAAYNAGVGRVYDAQVLAAYLHDDPRKWESIKEALPLLSKRYYTLHRSVWDQDRPKIAGWFGNSRQTVNYVDRVMESYENYRNVLN